jgi:quercetin dioxygenase-like cupin family protein
MSKTNTFEAFERDAKSPGFDEVITRHWEADKLIEEHTHPFEAKALVIQGELWLTYGGVTHHIPTGGTFHLHPEVPHSEHYGPQGATYWLARKNPSS